MGRFEQRLRASQIMGLTGRQHHIDRIAERIDQGYRLASRRPNLFGGGVAIGLAETDWNLAWFPCPCCGQRC
jgi:hypothetical protein